MKRFLSLTIVLLATIISFAQTQQGVVKTRGRMVDGQLVEGERLAGATITLNFGNPLVSSDQGTFSFNVPATKSYSLVSAVKQGYTLADPEYTRRSFSYSADSPFYVVLEDENQRQADINAATRKVRRTLMAQLDEREEEIESLKAQNKLNEKEYQDCLKQLYDNQSKSEQLVRKMAERYASTDYDQLDEFNRLVQMYIEEGELQKADSLIRSKGDIEQRVAEYHEVVAANNAEREKLEQSEKGAARTYEDLSRDLLNRAEIFLQKFQQDSALYCLKLRADLDTTKIKAVMTYADLCKDQGNFAECEKYYHIYLRVSIHTNDLPNTAEAQNCLGNLYEDIRDYANSAKYYKLSLENYEQLFQKNPNEYRDCIARLQSNLGVLYTYIGEYDKSKKYYKLALDNVEILFDQNPNFYRKELSHVQNNIGLMYSYIHDFAKSEKYYRLSLENTGQLFSQNPETYRADLGKIQTNLGDLYLLNGDYTNSEKYYKSALEIYEALSWENPDAYKDELARVQGGLGCLYFELHDYTNSERYHKMSLENFGQLFRIYPDAYRKLIASGQDNLGNVYMINGDFVNAEKYLMTALENREQLYNQYPDTYRGDLARTQLSIGSLYHILQDYASSEKHYKSALENYEQLFDQYPDTYRVDLARTQYGLGILYLYLQDYANSEKYYKSALKNYEQLFKNNPSAYRKKLAVAYWNLMFLYGETNDIDQYDSYLENTMRLYEALYKLQPEAYSNDVIELQNRKVWRLLNNGKKDEAIRLATSTYTMDESNEMSKYYLAECHNSKAYEYARESDYSNAQQSIDTAISLMPTNANFYDTKGEILLMQGKNAEALEMWKKVLELNPNFLNDYPDGTELSNGLKKLGLIE